MIRSMIEMLLDDVIEAQRALTRAILKKDDERRAAQYPRREEAARTLVKYVDGIEAERRRLGEECHRLGNEVMQIRYIAQLMRESAPLILSEAEARASAVVGAPETTLRSFGAAIADALKNGHAKMLDSAVVITYAGLLELARAKETREAHDALRAEHFALERRHRELDQKYSGLLNTPKPQAVAS